MNSQSAAALRAQSDVFDHPEHPFTQWMREFEATTFGIVKTVGHQTAALNAWNAALAAVLTQEGAGTVDSERVAQLIAHRACCGSEHDASQGKLHGCCVVCGVPWPCEYAGKPPSAPATRGGDADKRAQDCKRALEGLSQDALDGGWCFAGIEKYCKGLEARVAELTAAPTGTAPAEPRAAEGAGTAKSGEFDKFAAEFEAAHPEVTARGREWVKDYIARKLAPTAAAAMPAGGDAVTDEMVDRMVVEYNSVYGEGTQYEAMRTALERTPTFLTAPAPRGGVTEADHSEIAKRIWTAIAEWDGRGKDPIEVVLQTTTPAAQAQDAGPK